MNWKKNDVLVVCLAALIAFTVSLGLMMMAYKAGCNAARAKARLSQEEGGKP